MSYSQLSVIKKILNNDQYLLVEKYIISLSPNSKLTASKIAASNSLDMQTTISFLKLLVDEQILQYYFAIKCPHCGLFIIKVDSIADIESEYYCYSCEETFETSSDNVEVIYTFKNYPFVEGQQNEINSELFESAAPSQDSLTQLIASGILDLNVAFFSPTEQEYADLQTSFNSIFDSQPNTKSTGDTLENLTIKLFSLCRHFQVAPVRVRPNQIDCYVRNKLYIPGISQANCFDSFEIECKNEKKSPVAGYLNKLHSILCLSGKNFGIIVSRCPAPKTFCSLAHDIFLSDKIIIISLDSDDLLAIIQERLNLLECLERKIDEVKLNATRNLKELGLYNA